MSEALNIKKLEADLWESADLLRAGSKLTSNQYCNRIIFLNKNRKSPWQITQRVLKGRKSSFF